MSAEEDLRRMVDEPAEDSKYNSAKLAEIINSNNKDLNLAAAQIWTEKAAMYSQLVDMQEGESKRNLSDLNQNALRMAQTFRQLSDSGSTGTRPTRIGRIFRA